MESASTGNAATMVTAVAAERSLQRAAVMNPPHFRSSRRLARKESSHRCDRQMLQHMPFPFADGEFPQQLGAVIQNSVLSGREPARLVIHSSENDWLVLDGISHFDVDGSSSAHIWHAIEMNPAMLELASLPCGFEAARDEPGEPWVVRPFEWAPEH